MRQGEMARKVEPAAKKTELVKKVDVVRVVKRLGTRGAHFQFRQVREELGIPTDDKNRANRVWNYMAELISEKLVEEVPGGSTPRKRHKYYRVANDDGLRQLLVVADLPLVNGGARVAGSGPERLGRIEEDIRSILDRIETLNDKVTQLTAMWG